MKYIVGFVSMLLFTHTAFAQCKSGNCTNGKGVYDFGWCVYEGDFKNGKPDGKGSMKYDDYTYDGEFKNGVEDGLGTLTYKNGKQEKVVFGDGKKIAFEPIKVNAADFKPLDGPYSECLSGDCVNGFGTVQLKSGNKYTGNFKNKIRQGKGAISFANGDAFEGFFQNNEMSSGTYHFSTGYTFTGTWNDQAELYTGVVTSPTGSTVQLVNGKVITPPASSVVARERGALNCDNQQTCPHCHGKQIESKPIEQKLSWSVGSSKTVDRYGNTTTQFEGRSGGNTYQIPNYVPCSRCGGKGVICGK